MKNKLLSLLFAGLFAIGAQAQDTWEPKTLLTGYISTEFNYFSNLEFHDRNYATSISEAGFLATYQPLEKLIIKSVFVYRPNFSFDLMLNELYGEYNVHDLTKVRFGRFLTPLSPMNTYYYAPVNNSASIPLIISHHEYFPLNIDGMNLNGKYGNDGVQIDYDLFAGGYRNSLYVRTGAMKMFGNEDSYLVRTDSTEAYENNLNDKLNVGFGGHVGAGYKDIIDIGFGVFKGEETMDFEMQLGAATVDTTGFMWTIAEPQTIENKWYINKISFGGDITIKAGSFKLLAEAWNTKVSFEETDDFSFPASKFKTVFVEASNNFSNVYLTPYVRYEYHDAAELKYSRVTGGVAFRPIFSTVFKLEYMHYDYSERNLSGIVGSAIFAF